MKNSKIKPFILFIFGLILGALARVFNLYTQNIGNIFSEIAIWILLGTLISIYSATKKQAMINVFVFCLGMLLAYYFIACINDGIFSKTYIFYWFLFSLLSPFMAYFTWMTKEPGIFSKIISIGIVSTSILSTIVLFDKLRIYDYIINTILIYFLFFKKIKR